MRVLRERLEQVRIVDAHHVASRLERLLPPKNPERVEALLTELERRMERSVEAVQHVSSVLPEPQFAEALPITARKDEIIGLIEEHPVVVLAGETGSGKTTQIPKMCLAAGLGRRGLIGCTQPRRLAALSVSQRIAEELNTPFGQGVGCKIRFTEKTSKDTRIKLMTDGILLNELQNDPLLLGYDCIIVDEAHERSLNIDFILGSLRMILKKRSDLKVIITSATIDTERFSEAFEGAPIVWVSGRTYPVDIQYRPLEEDANDDGEISYLRSAVRTVEDILSDRRSGDVLVFLPTERDIRDACDLLGRAVSQNRARILPLYGRLAAGDQQEIFKSAPVTKVIVATNIAETSITLPGIRYVVDAGLARVSRFSAHTSTRRLPVEPISQSSAKQRAGRAGRVQEGICIRLYEERDFLSRPEFSTPEILRANLADVILRMKAFRLGEIETFPFIEPPDPRAIRGGYRVLEELGALQREQGEEGTHWTLTPVGKRLARLPADPSVGRMILEGVDLRCAGEVLVIASALSVQDPREVPESQIQQANQAHARFRHLNSDFMVFLKIWDGLHGGQLNRASNKELRQYCKVNFLSFQRMREWREVYDQLRSLTEDFEPKLSLKTDPEKHPEDLIHQAILSGCIANVAQKEDGNLYRATHGRKVTIFPGSTAFDRQFAKAERKGKKGGNTPPGPRHGSTPAWIVCAEWMETSRLFARTVAKIEPEWVERYAGDLLKRTYSEPEYDAKAGRVLIKERGLLYGLTVRMRKVGFHKIDGEAATDIFIREGIVAFNLPQRIRIIDINQQLREEVEEWMVRTRSGSGYSLDDRMYAFYQRRLPLVSDVHALREWVRTEEEAGGKPLEMAREDLVEDTADGREAFPDRVDLGGQQLDVQYAYKPGEADDGATLKVRLEQFRELEDGVLDWVIPGFVEQRIEMLIRALPKQIRRQLFPIAEKTREIAQQVKPGPRLLTEILSDVLWHSYQIRVGRADWEQADIPDYLLPRIEVVDDKGKSTIASGRTWDALQRDYQAAVKKQTASGKGVDRFREWKKCVAQWEQGCVDPSELKNVPREIHVCTVKDVPVMAYPALVLEQERTALRLLKSQEEARRATRLGMAHLVERAQSKEWTWLEKDLKALKEIGPVVASLMPFDQLRDDARAHLRSYLFFSLPIQSIDTVHIAERESFAKKEIRGIVYRLLDCLRPIFELRQTILTTKPAYPEFHSDLARIVPKDFLKRTGFVRLQHLPRYLNGFIKRNDRARTNPRRDAEKAAQIKQYQEKLIFWLGKIQKYPAIQPKVTELFWMLEEYRISVFAQELGTDGKISKGRLDNQLEGIKTLTPLRSVS